MGVHISRVKSVDLDSWTDEQMNSILSWGNARANKYWEAQLAAGHVPSEAKIENFIRTKYELKRWVMGPDVPDPATLDADGDDDVPLSLVKEKQTLERKESLRKASNGQPSTPIAAPQPQVDLIGGDDPIPRASTAGPIAGKVPPKAEPAPPKATSISSSLLGLDFLGSEPSPPPRPASTTGSGGIGGQSRPDLKQSILSLYASAPRPQVQQQPSHSHSGSFGSLASPTAAAPPQMSQQSAQSSMNDAFSNLSFSNISSPKNTQSSAFSGLGSFSSSKSPPPQQQSSSSSAFAGLGGGGFFDSKPAAAPPAAKPATSSSGFGGFGDFTSSAAPAKPAAPASSAMNDLFDFSSPAPAATPSAAPLAPAADNSVFNLSQPKSPAVPSATGAANPLASTGGSGLSGADVWGGNAWATPDPAPKAPSPQPAKALGDFGGWGSSSSGGGGASLASTSIVPGASGGLVTTPKVTADEEFGGWTSSTGPATGASGSKGFGASEDLFSNVWQ